MMHSPAGLRPVISAIEPARIHTRFHGEHGAPAWLATVTRV
jgi:hypothetical protein